MRILYYCWNEFTAEDCQEALKRLGHELTVINYKWENITFDEGFERLLKSHLSKKEGGSAYFDCAFSFNFFPILSRVCHECDVPYVSWIFDSPHLPLTSVHINHPTNHVYVFDKKLIEVMGRSGAKTLRHSPLAVDSARLKEMSDTLRIAPWEHEVCFLGTLYTGGFDFYDQIQYLPPKLKGFFDGVIRAEQKVFGLDLIGDETLITTDMIHEMHEHVDFQRTDQYTMDENVVLRDMLRRKVTKNERPDVISRLSKHFTVDMYTRANQPVPENVANLGYAEYRYEMPHIFNRTKVNINLTLRTILTGIPLRALDVMAAGGFLLSNYQEELAEAFVDGEECVMAVTPEDMVEKCAYYLTHDDEREEIARRGQEKVSREYSYDAVLPGLLKL